MTHVVVLYALVTIQSVWLALLLVKVSKIQHRSPPRERYTRATVTVGKLQVDAGLEWRENDAPIVGHDLWQICKEAAYRAHFIPPMEALISVETSLDGTWPDRAWFLEIGDEAGTYSQIFQPFGMPRWKHSKRWWQVWRSDARRAA